VAIGYVAVTANTTGSANIGVGGFSLNANTTGSNNVAVGYQALDSNTTASNNTAVGHQAGYSNQTGTGCVYVGYQAGYAATANGNVFMGSGAGASKTSGGNNVFIGASAGGSATTGTGNTFIGPNDSTNGSGYAVTSGSKNTIIGGYTGNQNSVDIRTASNYIVLSDGDGYPAFWGLGGASGYMRLEAGRLEFPATANPSSNANTLDDYEEGTWTPVLKGAGTAGTYELATSLATYTKIGRQVTLNLYLALAGSITGGGTLYAIITGVPFEKVANTLTNGSVRLGGVDFTGSYITVEFTSSSASSTLYFVETVDNGATIDLPISGFSANDNVVLSITYFT
jgi:hypothetical protein